MYRLIARLVLVAVALMALGCSGAQRLTPGPLNPGGMTATKTPEPPGPDSLNPGSATGRIEGNISSIQPIDASDGGAGRLGVVRIEGEKDPNNTFDKAVVTVTKDTLIYRKDGDALVPQSFEALAVGQTVVARLVGPVLESYPVQGTAGEIVILFDTPKN